MQASSTIRKLFARQDVILLVVVILMIVLFTILNPVFLSTSGINNVLSDWAPIMLLAIGETFVIVTRGIDISIGSTIGFSGVIAAWVIRELTDGSAPVFVILSVGILAGLATGAAVGLTNAFLIVKLKITPFISTLATMGAVAGLTLVVSQGVQIAGGPDAVVSIGNQRVLWALTVPLIIVIILTAIFSVVLHATRFGRWSFAIGSDEFAALSAGIPIARHLTKVYVLAGVLAGAAGMFVYFRLGSGSPKSGLSFELIAIASVVIGGTNLFGGRGLMSGTILGAIVTTAVLSGLILAGISPFWQRVVVGVLIAAAVALQNVRLANKGKVPEDE